MPLGWSVLAPMTISHVGHVRLVMPLGQLVCAGPTDHQTCDYAVAMQNWQVNSCAC